MKPKNYGKDISSVKTPVRFHLPDGSSQRFNNSTEAQQWFNQNYGNGYSMVEYVPTQGDSEHPIELGEVVVTAPAPKTNSRTTPTRRGFDRWIGANYSPRFNAASAKLGMNPLNWHKHIPKSYWNSDTHKAVVSGSNDAAAIIAAPFALYGLGAAYSVPEIAGAMNLYGAYEGIGRLTSDEGVSKTYNKFKSGDYLGGAKSFGGDVLDITMSLPFLNRFTQLGSTYGTQAADRIGFFVPREGTFTRGIGRGTEGLEDLINTGIVRGNPRGTEVTANQFAKLFRKNRDHFRDIMEATGIKNVENKFFSRTLTREEFDAIKKASRQYTTKKMVNNNGSFGFRDVPADPLGEYGTYDDYVRVINEDIASVERMPSRIASGEVKVNKGSNKPVDERFGANSDYVEDGTPLSYWYSDGRNPFSQGHDYAGSNYAVRVNNPEVYQPFMHESHLHPSFRYSPKLNDPNVEVFRRLPFGLGWRLNKTSLIK